MKVGARRRKGYAHSLTYERHTLIADEPPSHGGTDSGPPPTAMLAMSLASCTAITVEMYADRQGWDVGAVAVGVDYDVQPKGVTRFEVTITVPAELPDDQLERLREIASRCPVHRVLTGDVEITDRIASEPPAAAP
jgi:putative redox protein